MELVILVMCVCSCLSAVCGLGSLYILSHPAKQAEDIPPWEEGPQDRDTKPETQSLRMDEGFENLMAYQVKLGRGRSTGGEA